MAAQGQQGPKQGNGTTRSQPPESLPPSPASGSFSLALSRAAVVSVFPLWVSLTSVFLSTTLRSQSAFPEYVFLSHFPCLSVLCYGFLPPISLFVSVSLCHRANLKVGDSSHPRGSASRVSGMMDHTWPHLPFPSVMFLIPFSGILSVSDTVCAHICMCICVHVYVCRGHGSVSDLFPHPVAI